VHQERENIVTFTSNFTHRVIACFFNKRQYYIHLYKLCYSLTVY